MEGRHSLPKSAFELEGEAVPVYATPLQGFKIPPHLPMKSQENRLLASELELFACIIHSTQVSAQIHLSC